ncbi:MAG: glycosyltransferase family 2 protein, partial [Chloroflexota bacterium]
MQNAEQPFFSIVLPTKNRSQVVGDAIESVLWQTFDDYELVIIDNDDSDATKQVVEQYTDPRIRYVRTGELSMPDNWDVGIRSASGTYVTVLADKHVLLPTALQKIYDATQLTNSRIITWEHQTFHDAEGHGYLQPSLATQEWFVITTETILGYYWATTEKQFIKGRNHLPRGYNSATHHSLIADISGELDRVCSYIAPDYTFGFAQLALEDSVYHIDEVLYAISVKHSNGRNLVVKRNLEDIWESFGGKENFYNAVPVKSASLINNQIYNDYMNMQVKMGGNLAHHPFDAVAYYAFLFIEIAQRTALGVDMSPEVKAWEQAL